MGDKKQTAVNYIEIKVKQMIENGGDADLLAVLQHINKAKAMEEEQIKDAWVCGNNNTDISENGMVSDRYAISDESFYNKTYKQP